MAFVVVVKVPMSQYREASYQSHHSVIVRGGLARGNSAIKPGYELGAPGASQLFLTDYHANFHNSLEHIFLATASPEPNENA